MKIFIACNKHFYHIIPNIKDKLENQGHKIKLPNSYNKPFAEEEIKLNKEEHIKWKSKMMKKDKENIKPNDAILVLNFEKKGIPNYIGGATFLEISKEKYNELLEFFNRNAKIEKEDFQETHYFDCEQDLRIQKNNFGSKIWMKKGKIHDEAREEIEIKTKDGDFDNLKKLFENLGHKTQIIWLRDRKQFDWNGIKVCLDYTKGYGHIIEFEKRGTEEDKENILDELKGKFKQLNIELTPREEFEKQYDYYKENWRELIENALG